MARKIEDIKKSMVETQKSLPALSGLTSNSQVSTFGNLHFITAANIGIFEQLLDAKLEEIKSQTSHQAIGTGPWYRQKILEFQNGDNVELNTTNLTIGYPVVDTSKRIITRCSVKQGGNLIVFAKVAKSEPPVPISGAEKIALETYLNVIKPAGIQIKIDSLNADKLYITGVVYYSGIYSSTIKGNVIAALNNYMATFATAENFDADVNYNDIIDVIQGVEGVKDINIGEVAIRPDSSLDFSERSIIYNLSSGINNIEQETVSGYLTEEDTPGKEFTNSIAFVAV